MTAQRGRTREIVAGFGSPVRLFCQSNAGPAAARNTVARQAAGSWLALLDADDWWMPTKLERQLLLARHSAAGIIHTLANVSAPGIPDRITFDDLWQRNLIVNSSVLIRRATFDALGGFIEHADMRVCEDYNLWLRAAAEGVDIRLCRELLTYYRPGAGISSSVPDFLRGAECNISLIAARYGIDPKKVEQKRTWMMLEVGRMALGHRNLPLARSLLTGAFARNPHPLALVGTAAAHLPRGALDLARRWRDDGQGAAPRMSDDPVSLFTRASGASMTLPGNRPALLVIIDTEMETDCTALPPPTRGVTAMRHLEGLQRILRRHGIVPTYAVNYAVACNPDAGAPLRDLLADGRCDIGSQLHTWINPPFGDSTDEATSRTGGLPAYLEYDKIAVLTRRIEDSVGIRPILFRGGRYGAGAYTARILKHFGYRIDCTVLPWFDLRQYSGPDDCWMPGQPTWCDPERELLEIPATVGMTGALRRWGGQLYPLINRSLARRLGAPAFFRRLRLLDRCRLSPRTPRCRR